jgi:hypothetical protein
MGDTPSRPFTVNLLTTQLENLTTHVTLTTTTSTISVTIQPSANASVLDLNAYGVSDKNAYFTSTSTPGVYKVTINGSTLHKGNIYWYAAKFGITVQNQSTPGGGDDTDGDNPLGGAVSCRGNSTCPSDSYCNTQLLCAKVSCPSGYYATDHTCRLRAVFEVDITGYRKSIYLTQGEGATYNISIKNTGNQNLMVSAGIELSGNGINSTIEPSEPISSAPNQTLNFTFMLNTSQTTPIGNYSGKYKALTTSTAKDTVLFTLVVRPTASTIMDIETLYQNYTEMANQLLSEYERIRSSGAVTGQNLTLLEAKINSTRMLLNNTRVAIEGGNYEQANALLSQLRNMVNQTRLYMTELGLSGAVVGSDFWNNIAMWLVVGIVCIGAAGLLIYMLVPPQGYTHGKGYSPSGKTNLAAHIKSAFVSIRSRFSRGKGRPGYSGGGGEKRTSSLYTGSYTRVSSAYGKEGGGIGKKVKRIFGRG